jgi:hypothetical protein
LKTELGTTNSTPVSRPVKSETEQAEQIIEIDRKNSE